MNIKSLLKKRNLFSFFFSLFILFYSSLPLAADTYRIKGRVFSQSDTSLANIRIVLLKLNLSNKEDPSVTPIMKTKTDKNGNYFFGNIPHNPLVFYKVSATFKNRPVSSLPVRFGSEKRVLEVVLELPQITVGLEQLLVNKNILILEALEGGVNITEVMVVNNPTQSTLDGSNNPIVRKLPDGATNFRNFSGNQESFDIQETNGNVQIRLTVPPGVHQLIFNYSLSTFGSSMDFTYYPPKEVKSLELLVPSHNPLTVRLKDQVIPSEEKVYGKQEFISTLLSAEDAENPFTLVVDNLPIPQQIYFIPSIILFLLLMIALVKYLLQFPAVKENLETV